MNSAVKYAARRRRMALSSASCARCACHARYTAIDSSATATSACTPAGAARCAAQERELAVERHGVDEDDRDGGEPAAVRRDTAGR